MDTKTLHDNFVKAYSAAKYSEAIRLCTKIIDQETRPERRAVFLTNRALCHFAAELHKKCLNDCDAAITHDPTYTRAYVRKGQALWKLGKEKEARDVWTNATQIPGDLEYRLHGLWYLENGCSTELSSANSVVIPTQSTSSSPSSSSPSLQSMSSSKSKVRESTSPTIAKTEPPSYASAHSESYPVMSGDEQIPSSSPSSDFFEELKIDGKSLTPQEMMALTALQGGIRHGTGVIEMDRFLALGYLAVNTGRLDGAMKIFDGLLKRNSNSVAALLGRGTANALRGDFMRAIEDFSGVIKLDPTIQEAWKRRGQVHTAMGLEKEALIDMNESVRLSPDADSYQQRGTIYQKQKNYRRALEDFRKAYDLDPTNQQLLGHLAVNEYSLGNCLTAIEFYNKVIEGDPQNRDPYASAGQAYRDYGDFENAKIYFKKAMEIDPYHTHVRHLFGIAIYGTGNYIDAIEMFSSVVDLDAKNIDSRHMRAVAFHGLGQHARAAEEYDIIIKANPSHAAWYQRECALYQHNRLDTNLETFNMDMELHRHFKEGWCKKHAPESLPNYKKQTYNKKIPDVEYKPTTEDPLVAKYLAASKRFGLKMMLDTPGFLNNRRQQRACGYAMVDMAQHARKVFECKGVYQASGKTSSYDNKPHPFGYRDFLDVGIKWRQFSEPNDPVWWVDMLSPEQFIEGFGSQTPMMTGQVHVVRYFPYAGLSLEVMKKELLETTKPSPKIAAIIKRVKTVGDMYELMGRDFWVVTPCYSTRYPGKRMEGTRLTIQGMPPEGQEFSIRTPGTPPRWKDYDEELSHIWSLIVEEAKKETRDLDRLIDLVFSLSFYWFNFMPLSRGTAAIGYCSFHALLLALGYEIDARVPRSVQFDWEGILRPTTADFLAQIRPWATENLKPCTLLDELEKPSVEVFSTLRKLIEACNLEWPEN